jgi:hypothetical protein
MLVGVADEHATLTRLLVGLRLGPLGVGVELRGLDDLVQPVWRDRIDQAGDPLVDVPGCLLGQLRTLRDQPAGLPRRGLAGQDPRPGEREAMPQRHRSPQIIRRHLRRNTQHHPELGHGELRDLRATLTTQHHRTFAAVARTPAGTNRADVGMIAVGIDLGMHEEPRVGPVGLGTMLGGRLQQVGRRQRGQISIEHVF